MPAPFQPDPPRGAMHVGRLTQADLPGLRDLLAQDPVMNLFLLAMLDAVQVDQVGWYGVRVDGALRAACLVREAALAVPWAPDPEAAAALGAGLRHVPAPHLVVGPRADVDALWAAWRPAADVVRQHDQHLYVCDVSDGAPPPRGFRLARPAEWPAITALSAAMEAEDTGRHPLLEDADGFIETIRSRIAREATWVIDRGAGVQFVLHAGTRSALGAQIGGTFVPPSARRQGLATAGVRATTAALLRDVPVVTLHVDERNTPAVRTYQSANYRAYAPMRLLVTAPRSG